MNVHTRDARARAQARRAAAAARERMCALKEVWVGRRVIVPWPRDPPPSQYMGTVIDVWARGAKLRVNLDVGAGKARLKCHTVDVHDCHVVQDE